MKCFVCTKCCNFGPGAPCKIYMDKDCIPPTFCPSDDGKYPGAEWKEVSQSVVETVKTRGFSRQIRNCKDCGFIRYTNPTNYHFKGAAICSYRSRKLQSPYEIPDWCHLEVTSNHAIHSDGEGRYGNEKVKNEKLSQN